MTPAGTATATTAATTATTTTVAGLPVQTFTPSSFLPAQRDAPLLSAGVDRDVLRAAYVGRPLESVRTPAAVVDIGAVRRNCARMLSAATQQWRAAFRAHVKTHKTPQVALLQLAPAAPLSPDQPAAPPTAPTTSRTVVSTFPEAWGLISASGQDAFVRDQLKQYLDDVRDCTRVVCRAPPQAPMR